jgi:outer membrane immunogenic protein
MNWQAGVAKAVENDPFLPCASTWAEGLVMGRKSLVLASVAASLLFGATAQAADLPVRGPVYAPAVVAEPPFTWTGCYIGVNVGGDWARNKYTTNADFFGIAGLDAGSHTASGVIGGGQLGCNYQMNALVIGIEGMFDGAGLNGSHNTLFGLVTISSKNDWLANVTARVGYAWDRSLLYVKGGGAWMDETQTFTGLGLSTTGGSTTRSGWLVGAGYEYAFNRNWSAKLEWNYMDFGSKAISACLLGVCGPAGVSDKETANAVLLGANYRF